MLPQVWVDFKIVGNNFSNKMSVDSHSEGNATIWRLHMGKKTHNIAVNTFRILSGTSTFTTDMLFTFSPTTAESPCPWHCVKWPQTLIMIPKIYYFNWLHGESVITYLIPWIWLEFQSIHSPRFITSCQQSIRHSHLLISLHSGLRKPFHSLPLTWLLQTLIHQGP